MWRLRSDPERPLPGAVDIDVLFSWRSGDVITLDFVVAGAVSPPWNASMSCGQPFGLPFRVPIGSSTRAAHRRLRRWSSVDAPVSAWSGPGDRGRQQLVLTQDRSELVLEFLR